MDFFQMLVFMISSAASAISGNRVDEFKAWANSIFSSLQAMPPGTLNAAQIAEICSQLTQLRANAVAWLSQPGLSPADKLKINEGIAAIDASKEILDC